MTTFVLVRHAESIAARGAIAGRTPGLHLTADGVADAARLVDRLSTLALDAVYSSPTQRALETAQPLARGRGLLLRIDEALEEVDYGYWTGKSFDDLADDDQWRAWNAHPGDMTAPNGESIVDVQRRVVTAMRRVCGDHPDGTAVLVTHGDVIRAAVAHYLGMPLDLSRRIEITKTSATVIVDTGADVVVRAVNTSGAVTLREAGARLESG
jgi:probable phosphoglycerate mutase